MPPIINPDLCTLCGNCYEMCPQDVFAFDGQNAPEVVYPIECWYCGACVADCPVAAVRLRLPLSLHIVPSPALYGPPGKEDWQQAKAAASFSRSIVDDDEEDKG